MVIILPEEAQSYFNKAQYDDVEKQYYEKMSESKSEGGARPGSLASQIEKARESIQNSLAGSNVQGSSGNEALLSRLITTENRVKAQENLINILSKKIQELEKMFSQIKVGSVSTENALTPPKATEPKEEEDDDDDVDLFGSDDDEEEDAEAARIREERLKAYADKKSKKPGPIAKSSVLLDVKVWDDETDMAALEKEVRKIKMDGLLWTAAKVELLAYTIKKLSILCIVEDDKVSVDDLIDKIQEIEEYVQSVDIAAFNKI